MDILQKIKVLAAEYKTEIIKHRRHLHMYPELSFEEENTGKYIAKYLSDIGIPHTTGWVEHGVVATIEGGQGGPTIALRGDIDALPIQEANDVAYKSTNEGKMHACGHDVHTASLMGVAKILWELKDDIKAQ